MNDHSGIPVTDEEILDRVETLGAIVVVRAPVESSDFPTWRRGVRRAARARKMRLSVGCLDEMIIVSNPDHIVTDDQRAAAVAKMATHPAFQLPPDPCVSYRRLIVQRRLAQLLCGPRRGDLL